MTVGDLRTILLHYEDNMEVTVAVDAFVTGIKSIDPCVNMDTNKMSCMICGYDRRDIMKATENFIDDFIK